MACPLFYLAKPPAHWLMCDEIAGRVLMVPLAPTRSGNPTRCRPIGCYEAAPGLADQYRRNQCLTGTETTLKQEYEFYANKWSRP